MDDRDAVNDVDEDDEVDDEDGDGEDLFGGRSFAEQVFSRTASFTLIYASSSVIIEGTILWIHMIQQILTTRKLES